MNTRIRYTRFVAVLVLAALPLSGNCQASAASDSSEFRLNSTTAIDVFGRSALGELARAAAAGRAAEVARLVKAGVDPNGRGAEGVTPLFWSFFARNAEGMKALLRAGADPDLPMHFKTKAGEWDEYLVVSAAQAEAVELLEILLEHGADPESLSSQDTALTAGAACLECIKLLVRHGANVNRQPLVGRTVATVAAAIGHHDAIIHLLEHGYNVDLGKLAWYVQNRIGSSAVQPKKDKIIAMIRAKGVEPWIPDWQKKELEERANKDKATR
ncbi:MAG: ankyrin repeat domain-containing protein [Burkholderiaceae bacterium]|nr:ankyrin repeat domain-containing protein [Burkholderiaceae bacterium]